MQMRRPATGGGIAGSRRTMAKGLPTSWTLRCRRARNDLRRRGRVCRSAKRRLMSSGVARMPARVRLQHREARPAQGSRGRRPHSASTRHAGNRRPSRRSPRQEETLLAVSATRPQQRDEIGDACPGGKYREAHCGSRYSIAGLNRALRTELLLSVLEILVPRICASLQLRARSTS